jgi:F-type H+-transporting ATPase subunit b|uniref:ATP synthase subunit b n=1 Tax=Mesoaciditoga lauensis TaxID=1495039 RepID=A0A7V3RDJ1_9BACT
MSGIFLNFNGTSILQLMSFFILMYFLIKFLYKPFLGMIDKRHEEVKNEYETVAKDRKEAEELKEASKKKLDELMVQLSTIEEASKKRISEYEENEKLRISLEIESMLQNARKEIEEERDNAEKLFETRIVTLAIALASKVIQQEIDEKSKREYLLKQLSQIEVRK